MSNIFVSLLMLIAVVVTQSKILALVIAVAGLIQWAFCPNSDDYY